MKKLNKVDKTFETTESMRSIEKVLDTLQDTLVDFLKPVPFWKKNIPMSDKIALINEVARVKSVLWEEVYKKYPESIGKNLSFGQKEIKII